MMNENELADMPDEQEKKPRRKMVQVKVISHKGHSALVEYDGGNKRAYIPRDKLDGDRIAQEELDKGVRYGLEFERLITCSATPEAIAAELKRRGVWTYDNLCQKPHAVHKAFMQFFGKDLAALMQAAKLEVNK